MLHVVGRALPNTVRDLKLPKIARLRLAPRAASCFSGPIDTTPPSSPSPGPRRSSLRRGRKKRAAVRPEQLTGQGVNGADGVGEGTAALEAVEEGLVYLFDSGVVSFPLLEKVHRAGSNFVCSLATSVNFAATGSGR